MKNSILLIIIFFCISISIKAQNTTFNNVAIGTDYPAYGTQIKVNFPGYTGGWSRAYFITNETGSQSFFSIGSTGYATNGVSSVTSNFIGKDATTKYMTFLPNGNIGIGTINPTSKLTVAGNINSREVKVTVDAGADFVFENNYNLPSLEFVDKFIKENKHLPEIASAKEMQKDGINLSEMNIKLLQKIEEMTLYMIEIKKENQEMKKENEKMIDLEKRLKKIELNSK